MANLGNESGNYSATNQTAASDLLEPYKTIINVINYSLLGLVIISITGNTIIIRVMSLPRNRKSATSVFFLALAVSDILLAIALPLERWLHWTTAFAIYGLNPVIAVMKIIFNFSIVQISSWTLVCITIERVVSVVLPHKVKTLFTAKRASCVLFATCFLIITINAALFTQLVDISYDEQNGPLWQDKLTGAKTIIQWWDLCISFLIPFGIILTGSLKIVTQLVRASVQKHDSNKHRNNPVTRKLLAANIVFVLTMSPYSLFYSLSATSLDVGIRPRLTWFISDVLLFISDWNSTLNFFVYFLSGVRFRSDVKQLLACKLI